MIPYTCCKFNDPVAKHPTGTPLMTNVLYEHLHHFHIEKYSLVLLGEVNYGEEEMRLGRLKAANIIKYLKVYDENKDL